jgi:MFS family permease
VTVFQQLQPQVRRNLLALFAAGLLFWSSLASLLPTLPLYVQDIGGTDRQVGWVMGAFAIGLLLTRNYLGKVSDRRGRKLVLLIGSAVVALAPVLYLLVATVPLLMAVRAFHGISIAAFTIGYSTLVTDLSPPQHRGELIGYMSLVQPLGVAIGPAMGGFLQESFGHAPLFVVSAVIGAVAWFCATLIGKSPSPESKPKDEPGNSQSTSELTPQLSMWQLLFSPRVRVPALVMLFIGLVFGSLASFLPLYIKDTDVALNPGWFYTAAAIASFSLRFFVGKASDRLGRGLFITLSLCSYIISMQLLSHANTPIAFLIAGVLEGSGAGVLIPMTIALMGDRSAAGERGRVFSLSIGGFDLGIAIAGPVLGMVAESFGYRALFSLSGIFASIALAIFVLLNNKDISHSLRFATGRGPDLHAVRSGNS